MKGIEIVMIILHKLVNNSTQKQKNSKKLMKYG